MKIPTPLSRRTRCSLTHLSLIPVFAFRQMISDWYWDWVRRGGGDVEVATVLKMNGKLKSWSHYFTYLGNGNRFICWRSWFISRNRKPNRNSESGRRITLPLVLVELKLFVNNTVWASLFVRLHGSWTLRHWTGSVHLGLGGITIFRAWPELDQRQRQKQTVIKLRDNLCRYLLHTRTSINTF